MTARPRRDLTGMSDPEDGLIESRVMFRYFDGRVCESVRCTCPHGPRHCTKIAAALAECREVYAEVWTESRALPPFTRDADDEGEIGCHRREAARQLGLDVD
jgi:hypothetical protein